MSKDPAWTGNAAIDQAICGIGAGIVSTLCMHPLDLLKVQFQVANKALSPGGSSNTGVQVYSALKTIVRQDGYTGLYRGLTPNILGNASSWGLYFLWYTMMKSRMVGQDPTVKLSAGSHLLASAQSGVITAIMTNPLWVVKTRMFTSRRGGEGAYKNVFDGIYQIAVKEGLPGLYKGTILALVGVSNGAIQFMTYEELKRKAKERKRRRMGDMSEVGESDATNLTNTEYIFMSGSAKLVAIGLTYPYQVVRSRMQNELALRKAAIETQTTQGRKPYTSIMDCVRRTYRAEGARAFYNGLATNAIRVLPGTCVTFVVYEQLSRYMREKAVERDEERRTLGQIS